jgi:hypothetical protein
MPVIAPLWGDWITATPISSIAGFTIAEPNNVYYRLLPSPSRGDKLRMAADVATNFPFEAPFTPTMVMVVTWFAVAPYNNVLNLNTIQAVVAWDSTRSFVTLCVLLSHHYIIHAHTLTHPAPSYSHKNTFL